MGAQTKPGASPSFVRRLNSESTSLTRPTSTQGGASEEVLGRFLKANVRREAAVIATKLHGVMRDEPNGRGLSRKAVFYELDRSLRRLQTDYIDLYQIHRWDYETPIEETLEALHDVVKSGKVRYIGASSMYAWQFTKALYLAALHGWTRFVSMQNHYNLLYREEEREMLPLCQSEGISVIPVNQLSPAVVAHAHTPHEPASPVIAVRRAVLVLQQERHIRLALEQRSGDGVPVAHHQSKNFVGFVEADELASVRHLATEDLPIVFARHDGLRSRDEGGEEPVERLNVHRPATLAPLEEVAEAVNLGVGQRLVLGEGSHGHPATVTIRQHLLFSARLLFPR